MPQPKFSDIKRFCEIDGWQKKTTAKGKTGDHYRFRKTLSDGRILGTKASLSGEQIGDPNLWRRIWREQLGLDSEDQFWEALRTERPVERASDTPSTPEGPSLPGWLVAKLVRDLRLSTEEIAQLSEEEASARLNDYYSSPPG